MSFKIATYQSLIDLGATPVIPVNYRNKCVTKSEANDVSGIMVSSLGGALADNQLVPEKNIISSIISDDRYVNLYLRYQGTNVDQSDIQRFVGLQWRLTNYNSTYLVPSATSGTVPVAANWVGNDANTEIEVFICKIQVLTTGSQSLGVTVGNQGYATTIPASGNAYAFVDLA